jgi:hypothetical protein
VFACSTKNLGHRLRVVEALVLVLTARVLRRTLPMRRWARVLGVPGPFVVDAVLEPLAGPERRVASALAGASRRLRQNCLEQAFAASVMLRRRGLRSAVVIGLDREDPRRAPHAWLVGPSGRVVVGGDVMDDFRPVSQFGSLD